LQQKHKVLKMNLYTYASNIRYQVFEILDRVETKAINRIVKDLRKRPQGEIEACISDNYKIILEYLSKTPKQREKLEKRYQENILFIRILAIYELQKTALFLERLDYYNLTQPTAYRAFAVHTSCLLQEIQSNNILDRLEQTIQEFKLAKHKLPIIPFKKVVL